MLDRKKERIGDPRETAATEIKHDHIAPAHGLRWANGHGALDSSLFLPLYYRKESGILFLPYTIIKEIV